MKLIKDCYSIFHTEDDEAIFFYKTVFTGYDSFTNKIGQKATSISLAANGTGSVYIGNGSYYSATSTVTYSKIDKEV